MVLGTFQTVYDVSRDWGQLLVPMLATAGWLLGPVIAVRVARGSNRKAGNRLLVFVWLTLWTVLGGLGLGNVWYQHFHCIQELKSGEFLIAEGSITSFRPEVRKVDEMFTVGDKTFEYYSANLGGGGMRYTGGASGPLHMGAYVRVAYDHKGRILRLEIRQPNQ